MNIKIGDWVSYECPREYTNEIGYVTDFDSENSNFLIRNTSGNKRLNGVHKEYINKKLDSQNKLHKEELNFLIDLALQTRDFEWLEELKDMEVVKN